MTEASGAELIARYHRALAVGDYETVIALHAPDVIVWMSGESIVSGRFVGREALFAHMTHHVLGPLDTAAEEYVKGVRIVAADGDYVVAIFHGGLPNRVGGRYDQYYLQFFRLGGGVIREIVEIFDSVMFEEAVAGHRLATLRARPAHPFEIAAPLAGAADRDVMAGLAERWLAAVRGADWDAAGALAAPGCTLEVAGTTPLSGVDAYDGERLRAVLPGGIDWQRLVCADRRGAALLLRADDPGFPQQYGIVLEADGAQIGRISIFQDTVAAERHRHANPILPEPTRSIMPPFDVRAAFAPADAAPEASITPA